MLHLIQAQQYCSMLLTTMNNVASTTVILQAHNFWPCIQRKQGDAGVQRVVPPWCDISSELSSRSRFLLCFKGFIVVFWFSFSKINISRQYRPTRIVHCCSGDPALVAKLSKKLFANMLISMHRVMIARRKERMIKLST